MKVKTYFINNNSKYDWHVNLIPFLNFGNQVTGQNGVVINIGWLLWNININLYF